MPSNPGEASFVRVAVVRGPSVSAHSYAFCPLEFLPFCFQIVSHSPFRYLRHLGLPPPISFLDQGVQGPGDMWDILTFFWLRLL